MMPYEYQLRVALALWNKQDVLCITGTGTGKTYPMVMLNFLDPKAITWIVSPLNFIEDQQCDQFRAWGLRATAVNASTLTPKLLKAIKAGNYQVIISSPESYHQDNKLRSALLSCTLADRIQITVFDEAHCIESWGGEFCKAYGRCGDLRPLMLHPENSPVLATTATASESTRKVIATAVQLREGFHYENLGNFRVNMTHEIFCMKGGQKSFSEVAELWDPSKTINEVEQSIVFVNTYTDAHAVAAALRKHFKLTGKAARNLIPVYHSLKCARSKKRIERRFMDEKARILISTEALTMGADFPRVGIVANYLVPRTHPIWLQRAGRSGRMKGLKCRVVIMATPRMIKDAAAMCQEAKIDVSDHLLTLKVEEDAEPGDAPEDTPQELAANAGMSNSSKGRYLMSLGMAEYLVTQGCLLEVLDSEFDNPPHESCYEIGGCYNCKRRRQKDEDSDRLAAERATKREDVELAIEQYDAAVELKRRKPNEPKEHERPAKDAKIFKEVIDTWRQQKYLELVQVLEFSLDAFMTDKELQKISKFKITSTDSFDNPAVLWYGEQEWRRELLQVIQGVEQSETRKREDAEEERHQKERRKEEERQRKAQEKEERQRKKREKEEERQRQAQERTASQVLQGSIAGSRATPTPSRVQFSTHAEAPAASTSTFSIVPAAFGPLPAMHTPVQPRNSNNPAHTSNPLAQGRPINTVQLGANRLPLRIHTTSATPNHSNPSPSTPSTPSLSPSTSTFTPSPLAATLNLPQVPTTPQTPTFSNSWSQPQFLPQATSFSSTIAGPSTPAYNPYPPIQFVNPVIQPPNPHLPPGSQPDSTPVRRRRQKGDPFRMYTGPPAK